MTITKTREGGRLTLTLSGRLDANAAPELAQVIESELDGVENLTLDMGELVYLSSAGLRAVLAAQKRMNKQGTMVVQSVCREIMEVFEITGFVGILTIR